MSNARYLVFPTDQNTKSFSGGEIKLLHLNTFGEPASGASHIMVCVSTNGPAQFSRLISVDDGENNSRGFNWVEVSSANISQINHSTSRIDMKSSIFDGSNFVDHNVSIEIKLMGVQEPIITADATIL